MGTVGKRARLRIIAETKIKETGVRIDTREGEAKINLVSNLTFPNPIEVFFLLLRWAEGTF